MINIHIRDKEAGDEAIVYTLPIDLLCHHSPFFVASIRGQDFTTALERGRKSYGVLLLEENVAFFDVFLDYMRVVNDFEKHLLLRHLHEDNNRLTTHLARRTKRKLSDVLASELDAQSLNHCSVPQLHLELCVDFIKFCLRLGLGQMIELTAIVLSQVVEHKCLLRINIDDLVFMVDNLPVGSTVLRYFMDIGINDFAREKSKEEEHIWPNLMKSNKRMKREIDERFRRGLTRKAHRQCDGSTP